jgi:hypothetical protein
VELLDLYEKAKVPVGCRVSPLPRSFCTTRRKLIDSLVHGFLSKADERGQEIACLKDPGGSLASSQKSGL